jgi:RNA polymerase sigma-70 factor (ECF subfamily)
MAIDLGEDRKLITAAQLNPSAFSFVFARYYGPIFRYCVLRTGDPRDAEDLAMDVFTEAFAALPRFRWENRPLLAWLFSIARNRTVTRTRKSVVRGRRAEADAEPAWPDNGLNEACIDARRLLGRIGRGSGAALRARLLVRGDRQDPGRHAVGGQDARVSRRRQGQTSHGV